MHQATHLRHATVDRSVVHLGARVLLRTMAVVRHDDYDGEPVHVEVEVANIIDKDDGHAWVRLQATRARAIAARFPHEAAPESIAAGLGTVMSHLVDYPEAYASVTVLSPTMVAWWHGSLTPSV